MTGLSAMLKHFVLRALGVSEELAWTRCRFK